MASRSRAREQPRRRARQASRSDAVGNHGDGEATRRHARYCGDGQMNAPRWMRRLFRWETSVPLPPPPTDIEAARRARLEMQYELDHARGRRRAVDEALTDLQLA